MTKAKKRPGGEKNAGSEYPEVHGESFLPDYAEMAKLKEIDPNLTVWMTERLAREQDARHNYMTRKFTVVEQEQNNLFKIDVLTILSAFFIMAGGMLLSYTLLRDAQIIAGSMFGGGTLLLSARAFLNFRRINKNPG